MPDPIPGTPASTETRLGGGWAVSAAITLACLAAFLLCHQRMLHGEDSQVWVILLHNGDTHRLPRHFAFLPVMAGFGSLLRAYGLSWFEILKLASALGTALGVLGLHRAARLLLPAGTACWLPLAVAATPAWFFFATAAEVHGVSAAPIGLSWWAFARYVQRASPGRMLALGAACGTAASVHFSGYFLLPSFVATAWLLGVVSWRRLVGQTLALGLGCALAVAAIALLLGFDPQVQFGAATSFADSWAGIFNGTEAPRIVVEEGFVPFLPWSLLALPGLWFATARPWAAASVATTLLHLPLPVTILSYFGNYDEHGAYLLAAAVPAVLATLAWLPPRSRGLLLAVSAVLAFVTWWPRHHRSYDPEFAAGVAELRADRPFAMLIACLPERGFPEMNALVIRHEDLLFAHTNAFRNYLNLDPSQQAQVSLEQWFDGFIGWFESIGKPLLITEGARAEMATYHDERVRTLWRDHVEPNYEIEPVRRRGLEGSFLKRRVR